MSTRRYRLSVFSLDDKDLAVAVKLAELRGTTVDELELRFDRDAIERARSLNVAHAPEDGWVTLICRPGRRRHDRRRSGRRGAEGCPCGC
jgi:hypothetical protein